MAKNREFENGAVIMNNRNQFLATTNGRDFSWENGTENALCFRDNKEAERFIDNNGARIPNNNRSSRLEVRIVASNCNCGCEEETTTTSRSNRKTNTVTVTPEILALAVSALKGHMKDFASVADAAEQIDELEEAKAELEAQLSEVKSEIKEIKDSIFKSKKEIDRILSSVLSPTMVEAVKAELFK